ncbi:MAG: hypothetical protein JWN25_863 [Verrucomicrobiales bacterium]|nr:hypothetical protein [Verrucomicrobiales bacterium]MDB6131488.1 hypothetical protein [Verrucomicrobiales bacterium]
MEISKRDYFAAHALTGITSRSTGDSLKNEDVYALAANEAYLYADAMMRLSKTLRDPVEIDPNELVKRERDKGSAVSVSL